jgi:hypothetical protein
MKYLKDFPSREQLTSRADKEPFTPLNVNGHIHTPYSFSAFTDMNRIFEMAGKENIKVLGINDFYETEGYEEFAGLASENKVFPLFNIETITLAKDLQAEDIRVNDPNNPGRIYFSGKGLDFPVTFSGEYREMLEKAKFESQYQISGMIAKLNDWLKELDIDISFTGDDIRRRYARKLVRERHIAQALHVAVFELTDNDAERKEILQKLYSGNPGKADLHDDAALENELRNNLLKAGKKAFVPEDEKTFLTTEQAKQIFLKAGGIPCYPVLLDDAKGNCTEFERDREALYRNLVERNIYSIELIPGRNSLEILEPFVRFFYEKEFVITFGTEHNAPGLIPLTVTCRGGAPLTDFLRRVNYEGTCIIAAHQYLRSRGLEGYVNEEGKAQTDRRSCFTQLGNAVIRKWVDD